MRDPLWRGIYRHGRGWIAYVSQGRSLPQITKHFSGNTSPREIQRWREDEKARLRLKRKERANQGSFEGDARRYLRAVTAMPTYTDRQREIAVWISVFGTKSRQTITSADIREQRDHWLMQPRAKGEPPLAAGTVNKRLRALSNLYRVLDGPHVHNPVRDVAEALEPTPKPRDLDYETIQRILDAVPDWGRTKPKMGRQKGASVSKARLRVLAFTGLPPKTLQNLTRADIDFDRGQMVLPIRRKGKGASGAILPLLPPAVDAFRELDRLNGWGKFQRQSLNTSFKRACRKVGVSGASLYTLRHSFATLAYTVTGSLETVMVLLQHESPETTKRYTQRAAALVLQQKTAPLLRHFVKTDDGANGNA